jgi:small nuclear ribonucleoprotein (snRNP)-like protein
LQKKPPTNGIYKNQRFANASSTILGCPVVLKVKSNETFHGIFSTYSADFDVVLECCHKIDPQNEVLVYGKSLPKKADVQVRYFERENIVEMTATEVDKDFAVKSKHSCFNFFVIFCFLLTGENTSIIFLITIKHIKKGRCKMNLFLNSYFVFLKCFELKFINKTIAYAINQLSLI